MKAIFAVSALAAAISAQAIAADTEATWSYTGEISYVTTFDLDAEDRSMGVDAASLSGSVAIVNGGFSGTINLNTDPDATEVDLDDADAVTNVIEINGHDELTISDLQYTEGAILFGQGIGSIVSTAGSVGNMSSNTDYDAADGFRYTTDMGLVVQLEAGDTDIDEDGDTDNSVATDFGLAAAYSAELGGAMVTADVQYREANSATKGADTMTRPYMGVKVEAAAGEMIDLTVGATMGGEGLDKFLEDSEGGANTTSYGARADVTVMENVSAYAYYSANVRDAATDNEVKVGADATFAPLSVGASYANQLEAGTSVIEAYAKLSQDFAVSEALTVNAHAETEMTNDGTTTTTDWSAGVDANYAISDMTSAYAGYELVNAGDDTELTAGVVHTTEGGASLTAAYRNATAAYDDDGLEHTVKLTASYSF